MIHQVFRRPIYFAAITSVVFAGCTTPDRWGDAGIDADPFAAVAAEGAPQTPEPDPVSPPEPMPSGPLEISLEDAVFMALRQNPNLQIQQLNPLITGAFEQIERGVFDPELFASFAYSEESASETDRATSQRINYEAEGHRASAGVRQGFPTGTHVEVSVDQDRNTSNRSPEQQSARVGLTVTQQLLRGFGPTVNLAAIRQAQFDTVASQFELRGYVEAFLGDVEIAYWNFVLAEQRIAIFERSRDVARRQLEEIQERVTVGALSRNELAAASAEVALREQDLIDARSFRDQQRLRLLLLLSSGVQDWHALNVIATSSLEAATPPVANVEERIELALQSRADLNEARLRLQRNELDVVVTRNGLLPRLELFATLGRSGYADNFSDSFRRMDNNDYDLTVGVNFTHLIGNRPAESRNLIARATLLQSEQAIENLRNLIRFDVSSAVNEVERARQQIDATAQTRSFRAQSAEAEQERFAVGTSTALDVAFAQRDLLASEIEEVEARVAYQIARIQLHLAEGTLLERRGLAMPSTFEAPAL